MHLTWETSSKERIILLKLDEEPWKKICKSLFINSLPFLAASKDVAELEERWRETENKAAKRLSLYLLARRSYFSEELKRKLKLKFLSPSAIEYALCACKRLGYLDDERAKELFIEKERRRGRGPQLIACKLRERGVSAEVKSDQIAEMRALLKTRYQKRDLKDFKERQKVARLLLQRGFDFELIKKLLN
jgi:SOS response regulatory protein OraA/RecX